MGGGRMCKVTAPGLLAKTVLSDGSGVKWREICVK